MNIESLQTILGVRKEELYSKFATYKEEIASHKWILQNTKPDPRPDIVAGLFQIGLNEKEHLFFIILGLELFTEEIKRRNKL